MRCDLCGKVTDYASAMVDNEVWEAIGGGNEMWCLTCIDKAYDTTHPNMHAEVRIGFTGTSIESKAISLWIMNSILARALHLAEDVLDNGPSGDRTGAWLARIKADRIPDWFIEGWLSGGKKS